FFFFFQAEDGIRDFHVTGVQTCALPIFALPRNNPLGAPTGTPLDSILAPQFRGSGPLQDQGGRSGLRMPEQLTAGVSVRPIDKRSEERRVGKRWRTEETA